ncbi:Crp/Fnr family transcriptional regulator [Myroides pelagicus]|nr:Crp/Fnr family transcriptional regulator [Myroides pelagicus]
MQIRNYRKNQVIQQPNSRCKTLYFVTKGVARIYYFKDAKDITEHFAFDANIIIRAESLFTKRTTPKAIQALTDLTVVAIPAQELFCLFETNLEVERLFNKIFIQAYIQTTKRVESLQFQSATERYYELLTQTNLINQIPLKHIASYLGITQVSLSRIRASI